MNNIIRAMTAITGEYGRWVQYVPAVMMSLNAMPHGELNISASMAATGREMTLPSDLQHDGALGATEETWGEYVDALQRRLQEVRDALHPRAKPVAPIKYAVGDYCWVATNPLERNSKFSPRWAGPYVVLRMPNPYQVIYRTPWGEKIAHTNNTKPDTVYTRKEKGKWKRDPLPVMIPPLEETDPRPPHPLSPMVRKITRKVTNWKMT